MEIFTEYFNYLFEKSLLNSIKSCILFICEAENFLIENSVQKLFTFLGEALILVLSLNPTEANANKSNHK